MATDTVMNSTDHDDLIARLTLPEKVALLDKIIADQRQILSQNVSPDLAKVPQIFVPYKEVLEIYRAGVKVPDDVTIVWPDDNFGYIRQFASPIRFRVACIQRAQQQRCIDTLVKL